MILRAETFPLTGLTATFTVRSVRIVHIIHTVHPPGQGLLSRHETCMQWNLNQLQIGPIPCASPPGSTTAESHAPEMHHDRGSWRLLWPPVVAAASPAAAAPPLPQDPRSRQGTLLQGRPSASCFESGGRGNWQCASPGRRNGQLLLPLRVAGMRELDRGRLVASTPMHANRQHGDRPTTQLL